ncbi:centrosomal protein of 72 kDa [Protopterus annectens]|uniref:centrosomal protein of 72 kDa n=1 Tax=Protopterus annectens TaxID=7888 RepID=UPI001CFA9100|nr:centrosomal protein of 72 kDa [Protopterus annectens]
MAALILQEEYIRSRVNLQHQNLGDVRSLCLPGTYQEKITHLGNGLKNLIRLKSLDLSRNALVSLEGIQHLKLLERLNLYYNNISSMSEVLHLRNLTALRDLDLRLNPVTKSEPDYRLLIIHMLPNLRRLDDRPVRDSERKAALLHFSTEQAYALRDLPVAVENENDRTSQPRVAYVNSLSKKMPVLDEEAEIVLNMITKCGWDMNKPRELTGSVGKVPEVELHTLQAIREMDDRDGAGLGSGSVVVNTILKQPGTQKINIPKVVITSEHKSSMEFQETGEEYHELHTLSTAKPIMVSPERERTGARVTFATDVPHTPQAADANLKFQDEAEAYHRISSQGNFTPHPGSTDATKPLTCPKNATAETPAASASPLMANGTLNTEQFEQTPMECFLDLVDNYWNGFKSLHSNKRFLTQARQIFPAVQMSAASESQASEKKLLEDLSRLTVEKQNLESYITQLKQEHYNEIQKLTEEKNQIQKEKHHIPSKEFYISDNINNTILKRREFRAKSNNLSKIEIEAIRELENNHNLAILPADNGQQICIQQLVKENDYLKQQLQLYERMQELTDMLKENHRTLVSTNEHLLKELEEIRIRHSAEVRQLNWSYNQLKKTIETVSHNS